MEDWWLKGSAEEVADKLSSQHSSFTVWNNHPVVQSWVRNQITYYSSVFEPSDWDTSLIFDGEQGELVKMQVPQARSLIRQMVSIITKKKLSFNALAESMGSDVIQEVRLGEALGEQIVDEQRLDKKAEITFEKALIHGSGYLKCNWRSDKGRPYVGEEKLSYEGDIEISSHSVFDVFFDHTIEDWQSQPWVEVRTTKNRWDLIAQHPELKKEIMGLPKVTEWRGNYSTDYQQMNTDDLVYTYEMFVRPCPAIPKGRMIMYSDAQTIYFDGENRWDGIPVEEMCPEHIDGMGFGYPFFSNMIPLQEMLDHSFSAIATNQSAFAVQNVTIPRGSGIGVEEIGGMNFISFTPQSNVAGGGRPEALQLTKSAPETFKFIDYCQDHMQQISNINSSLRGSPPPGVTSGVAIATLSTNALEFLDTAGKAYTQCLERTMMWAVTGYRKFATVEHQIRITGRNNQISSRVFEGKDLEPIKLMKMVIANPLMQTTAGRLEVAQKLIESGLIKNPQEYLSVLDGEPVKGLYEDELSENDLIHNENEALLKEEDVIALSTDDHPIHIRKHAALLNDPKVRFNNERVEAILNHMMEHQELATNTDPMFMAMVRTGKMPEGGMQPPQVPAPKPPSPPPGEDLPPLTGEDTGLPSATGAMPTAKPAEDLLGGIR